MAQINREGTVNFGDASLSIWEEPGRQAMLGGEWGCTFKRQVFARIIQQLKRLGWTVGSWKDAAHYKVIANDHRSCNKGALRGELEVSGRTIKFEMFQPVNCPTRPDNEGRYESDKEGVMPYLLRLEMERTRRHLRDYLRGVFSGYRFDTRHYSIYYKPLEKTAMERIRDRYAESSRFKGDWESWISKKGGMNGWFCSNQETADGAQLQHGQRVWFHDWHGRTCTGTAYYNINNMWWVVTGKYDLRNMACFELYTQCPENPRIKRNGKRRRQRLEKELAKAVKAMDFKRAELLKNILFPQPTELFLLWHREHKAYHCPQWQGYTTNPVDAGRFTQEELKDWGLLNDIIPVKEAA